MSKETLFNDIIYAADWAVLDASTKMMQKRNEKGPVFFNQQSARFSAIEQEQFKNTEAYIRHVKNLISLIHLLKNDPRFADCFASLENTVQQPHNAAEAAVITTRIFEFLDAEDSEMLAYLKTLKAEAENQYKQAADLYRGTYESGVIMCVVASVTLTFASTLLFLAIGLACGLISMALLIGNIVYFSDKSIENHKEAARVISEGITAIESFEDNCVFHEITDSSAEAPEEDENDNHSVLRSVASV